MTGVRKRAVVAACVDELRRQFDVVPMAEHAGADLPAQRAPGQALRRCHAGAGAGVMNHDLPAMTACVPLPLVTVVVPAYNEALKLDGLAHGDLRLPPRTLHDRYRFEVIVVDDGSTDEHRRHRRRVRRGQRRCAGAAPRRQLPSRAGPAVRLRAVAGRLRGGVRLRPQLLGRPHRPHARRHRARARPDRRRLPLHEGRPDQRHPVAAGGHEQGRQPAAARRRRTATSTP